MRRHALHQHSGPPGALSPAVALQLAATRGQLSLELPSPARLGPLLVTSLAVSLPGLSFPIDLSGGVSRFRHRRGVLESLAVRVALASLAHHLAPMARGALGETPCELTVVPGDGGLEFGLHHDHQTLAFSALFAPEGDTARMVVANARGVGLVVPAHGAALRAAEAMAGRHGARQGSLITFPDGLQRLVRVLRIDAGARAPDTSEARFTDWIETDEGFEVAASRGATMPEPSKLLLRELQTARLACDGDDALARGDLEAARAGYLAALEQAPRHAELSLRIAEIDLLAGHRPESALGMLIESLPAVDAGRVGAHLLAACGDADGAMVACRRAAEREPVARTAALLLVEAASHANSAQERTALLDEAVARAPAGGAVRKQRALARLAIGDLHAAAADFDQLEASVRGSARKFEVCVEAGRELLGKRCPAEASRFFQRALRYLPSSAEATAGMARALLAVGDGPRAVALLSRAVGLTRRADQPASLLLELATCLAEIAGDLPAAIAHARSVPFGIAETVSARALEGRWRATLGDLVGASQAFAQARDAAESLPSSAEAAPWLAEAARFELDVRNDPRTAQRHLAAALQRSPRDPQIRDLFRKAGSALAAEDREPQTLPPPAPADEPVTQHPPAPSTSLAPVPTLGAPIVAELPVDPEEEIEKLSRQVQANPQEHATVIRLCMLLHGAQKHMELFALASARLEEAPEAEDASILRDFKGKALRALAQAAREAGRDEEAALYEQALREHDPL